MLFKMLSGGIIDQINGCISTGKEANVYHATSAKNGDCAIKVYKTSILVFKVTPLPSFANTTTVCL
jgi:RIO kinase 1